jgi:hypothetical protein
MASSVTTEAKDNPILGRLGPGPGTTWAGALAGSLLPLPPEAGEPRFPELRARKDTSSSSMRGSVGVGGEAHLAGPVARMFENLEGGGVGRVLPSTMFAILATSRSRGAIFEIMRSNSCLTSEGGVSADWAGGVAWGRQGVLADESEAESGMWPVSGSCREETAPGGGRSSSMALPGAWTEAEITRVSALKSMEGRGSPGSDMDQSLARQRPGGWSLPPQPPGRRRVRRGRPSWRLKGLGSPSGLSSARFRPLHAWAGWARAWPNHPTDLVGWLAFGHGPYAH